MYAGGGCPPPSEGEANARQSGDFLAAVIRNGWPKASVFRRVGLGPTLGVGWRRDLEDVTRSYADRTPVPEAICNTVNER